MKYTLFILLLSGIFNISSGQSPDKKNQLPEIFLVYPKMGTPFDRTCGSFLNKPVKEEWIQETGKRLSEFQALWDKEGAVYLQAVIDETGLPFPYRQMQATLTVCAIAPMSSPLIINMKHFLSSAEKPFQLSLFPEILFHELMHTYVRAVNDNSALRKKYAAEQPVTLNHLHVMALEKFVLLKLGKTELFKWVDTDYRTGDDLLPAYKRAWEIVNDIEDYQDFIKELKLVATK